MENTSEPRYFINVLERALNVMGAFNAEAPEMTLSEIASRTDLDRATARRIILTLVDLGYAEKDGKIFRLRPRVLQIGYGYLTSLGIAHRGQYVLESLTGETNESCSLSVLDGGEIVYVARSTVPGLASIAIAIGARLPAHATAMGRVLLAALPPAELDSYFESTVLEKFTPKTVTSEAQLRKILKKVRDDGYAYIQGELTGWQANMEVVAVPVVKPSGRVIAAISLYTGRVDGEQVLGTYLPKLRNAAKLLAEG